MAGICLFVLIASLLAPPTRSAADLARAVDAHYHAARTLAAVFLETYRSGGRSLRAESGKVYFSRPGRMRWDYDFPNKKMFLVDGKNVWYYVPADHTASRTTLKQSDDWRTPLALLAGNVKLQRLCGSLQLSPASSPASPSADPELRPAEPGNTVLVCHPRKEDEADFREVLFEINPHDQFVRVTVRQPGGIEMEFRFGDWKENMPLPEAEFHFEPPAGVAIVNDTAIARQVQ